MKYWIRRNTSLWTKPDLKDIKLCDLYKGTIVYPTDEFADVAQRVLYKTSKGVLNGWVYRGFLELVRNEFEPGVVPVPPTTYIDPNRPAQYIVWDGRVQYNLCGEFCASYIFQESIESVQPEQVVLSRFLNRWKSKPVSLYHRVFKGGLARTTGISDLRDMVAVYGGEILEIQDCIYDPVANGFLFTPELMADWLETGWQAIIGCRIETRYGRLRSSGVLHWIVVDRVVPDDINNGWVEIYNPFPNQRQRLSWEVFAASVNIPYGIFVRKPV